MIQGGEKLETKSKPDETLIVEFLQRIAAALEGIQAFQQRIADHLAPEPNAIVGTPYIARKLGCSTKWIGDMIRSGAIPKQVVVTGTGNGKLWKFYRTKVDEWVKSR